MWAMKGVVLGIFRLCSKDVPNEREEEILFMLLAIANYQYI